MAFAHGTAGVRMQVLHACTKISPQPYRDEALLHAVATAASRRWGCGWGWWWWGCGACLHGGWVVGLQPPGS